MRFGVFFPSVPPENLIAYGNERQKLPDLSIKQYRQKKVKLFKAFLLTMFDDFCSV
jgi:hypothetical protein